MTLLLLLVAAMPAHARRHLQTGMASWHGANDSGQRTADGNLFDPGSLTATHRTLPLGTCVRVKNLTNGRTVIVRINDRGPFTRGRLIDLSEGAAVELGMKHRGVARVRLHVLATCPEVAAAEDEAAAHGAAQ